MKVKKYIGESMQDTIFKVKADLGPDAIILNTRKYKKGLFGIFGKNQVEVLAALEEGKQEDRETLKELSNLKNMLSEMNQQWQSDTLSTQLPQRLNYLYQHLQLQGVKKDFCREFIYQLQGRNVADTEVLSRAGKQLELILNNPQPISGNGKKVIAFIGPTGVGKTTTIAKLAARFTLDENKKVGLITADTYRIAAVQQLKTYSDIINVPLQVIYNREELKQTINEKYQDYDLILVDTAGSSWNDKIQLGRLKKIIEPDFIDEVHLIISMNTKSTDIKGIIEQFSILNPDKIILSKLDETMTFGDIINIKEEYGFPYSYITFGQDVPDDIQVADSGSLVQYLIGDIDV